LHNLSNSGSYNFRELCRTGAGQLAKPDNAMAAVVGHRGQFAADRCRTSL